MYSNYCNSFMHSNVAYYKAAVKTYDLLEEAIKLIGYDGIEKLKYKTTDIKRQIVQRSPRISEPGFGTYF